MYKFLVTASLAYSLNAFSNSNSDLPRNHFLADSPWPIAHGHPYAQGSSSFVGPKDQNLVTANSESQNDFKIDPVSITLAVSGEYKNQQRVIWGNTLSQVYKLSYPSGTIIDVFEKNSQNEINISGAYTLVDSNNEFYAPTGLKIEVYSDFGNLTRKIELVRSINISKLLNTVENEHIVGMNLSFSGDLVFVTNNGLVGVLARDFSYYHFKRIFVGKNEIISNSIAIDENNGVYIVSSKKLYKVVVDENSTPKVEWDYAYESDNGELPLGRIGPGSGTTPTLMGTGDQDKFVVFGDGLHKMNVLFLWRDNIPDDWKPSAGNGERRLAGKGPITFGLDTDEENFFVTEQSLLVSGYGVVAVSNVYPNHPNIFARAFINHVSKKMGRKLNKNEIIVAASGFSRVAPRGIEKISWDPDSRTVVTADSKLNKLLGVAWQNPDIRCPNGIPTLSTSSSLMYCIGLHKINRSGINPWTLEAIDWESGELKYRYYLNNFADGIKRDGKKFNSMYAGTEIIGDGLIATGNLFGASIISENGEF